MFTEKSFQLCYKTELFLFKIQGENSTKELKHEVEEISQKENKTRRKRKKEKYKK